MSAVWKRLQRVNKRAAKFQFVASYQELVVEGTKKWQPNKLVIVWTRRSRRYCTQAKVWEPTLQNPNRGLVVWTVPENVQITVTLFKDQRTNLYEDKEWTFVIENVSTSGKRHLVASASVNMQQYASMIPSQTELKLKLKPLSKKVAESTLAFTLSCAFLREGKATDEDMQSLASLMSLNMPLDQDIGNLDDFDDDVAHDEKASAQISEFASKLAELSEVTVEEKIHSPIPKTPSLEGIRDPAWSNSTSSEDILTWCREVTQGYPGVKVTNLTTSWRSGMAFCAIIHRFHPDLIPFDSLSPHDIKGNCKRAFDAAERLGVARVIEPSDMVFLNVPDKLAVMTYLHQLKMHFTGQQIKVQQLGDTADSSIYILEEDHLPEIRPTIEMDAESISSTASTNKERVPVTLRMYSLSRQTSMEFPITDKASSDPSTPVPYRERSTTPPEIPKTEKKSKLAKILNFKKTPKTIPAAAIPRSSSADSCLPSPRERPFLMTRNQYMNPFDSDEEEEEEPMAISPSPTQDPSTEGRDNQTPPEILDLSPARLKRAQSTPSDQYQENDPNYIRQQELREKAKKLINDAKQGTFPKFRDYPGVGVKNQNNLSNRKSKGSEPDIVQSHENSEDRLFFERIPDADKENSNIPSFGTSSPFFSGGSRKNETTSTEMYKTFYNKEFSDLDREQKKLDDEGKTLEELLKPLLAVCPDDLSSVPGELLEAWFNYVNKRNALIRREADLLIMEKEEDLVRKMELLRQELRLIFSIEETEKTEIQRHREAALLSQLVDMVNKRDELAHYQHSRTIQAQEEEEADQRRRSGQPPELVQKTSPTERSRSLNRARPSALLQQQQQVDDAKTCSLQ